MRLERKFAIHVYLYKDYPDHSNIKLNRIQKNVIACDIILGTAFEELLFQLDLRNIKWYKIRFMTGGVEPLIYQPKLPELPKYIYDRYNAVLNVDREAYKKTFTKQYKKENSK